MRTLFLITGLPGAGKSTYVNNYFNNEYMIYDDANFGLSDFREINSSEKDIVIVDTRLLIKRYLKYIKSSINIDNVEYIFIDTSKDICIENIKKREKDLIKAEKYINSIKFYSDYIKE